MSKNRLVLSILLILGLSFAITINEPVKSEIKNGDTVDLGTIGPGQTVTVRIGPAVTTGGIYGQGGVYDNAVASKLPANWKSVDSKLYGKPLEVFITADPYAEEGEYLAEITVTDENFGEKLESITFSAKVKIVKDVMEMKVAPNNVVTGPEQPARFEITVTNKGNTADVFQVSTEGAQRWGFKKLVYVGAKSSKKIYYEIAEKEEGSYDFNVKVVSTASELIADKETVSLRVRSGLLGDYKATNNGILIFPFFESSIYALAGLISNLY